MKAHHINGRRLAVTEYNTSTVTLATKSGRPDVVTWAEIDYLESEDGLQRHRDVVDGQPTIIVQSPPDRRWQPYEAPVAQGDLFATPPNRPQNDEEDAISLIDLIDSEDSRKAVLDALASTFEGDDKQRFWGRLNEVQKRKLRG